MSNPNSLIKKKQRNFLIILVGGLIIITMVIVSLKKKQNESQSINRTDTSNMVQEKYSALGDDVNGQQLWMAKSSTEIKSLRDQNEKLKKQLSYMKKEFEEQIQKAIEKTRVEVERKIQEESRKQAEKLEKLKRLKATHTNQNRLGFHDNLGSSQTTENYTGAPFSQGNNQAQNNGVVITNRFYKKPGTNDIGQYRGEDITPPSETGLVSVSFEQPKPVTNTETPKNNGSQNRAQSQQTTTISGQEDDREKPVIHTSSDYIPAGSFVHAILLGGVDAATGGQAQQDPQPVLLDITDPAELPNSVNFNIKSCRVVGSAYGDINSERARIRVEKLSCIDTDNIVHEANAKGFVFGEDGKAGVRGKVVTKQGQILTNALLAGIASGIGSAFQQSATSTSTSALGAVSTVDPNKVGEAGLGAGVNSAMDRLSKYYIDIAEKMFPVIEVDSGRAVDIVFTSGLEFDVAEKEDQGDKNKRMIAGMVKNAQGVTNQVQSVLGLNRNEGE